MALVLIATAGAGDANSYATAAQGDTYHETHPYASTWTDATTAAKEQALVWATRLLDTYFTWAGVVTDADGVTQALGFPRRGAYDRQGRLLSALTLPTDLVNATCELARLLMDEDRTDETTTSSGEIQALKVGSIEIEYGAGGTGDTPVIADAVVVMLRHLGVYRSSTYGTVTMRRG